MWDVQDLFRRHNRDITRFLQRRVSSPEVAADLAQDLFLRLLTTVPAGPVNNSRGYLFQAAGNLAINHNKRQRLVDFVDDPACLDAIPDDAPNAERWLLSRQELAIIARTLTEFPLLHREVFMLSRVEGLSFGAISKRLGIPRQTAFDHLVRIVTRLQVRLGEFSR
jgi:RNA polymerase sigma factor (sigma-70 family)